MTDEPSLTAALFLIAIDPETGRLVKRRRRRFRKALASTHGTGATRARRAAIRELRDRGLISFSPVPGHHPLVPGSAAPAPMGRLRRGIDRGFDRRREIDLCLLLTWCGVLQQRLTRSERRTMARRLRLILLDPENVVWSNPASSGIGHAVGRVVFKQQMDLIQEAVEGVLSGDALTFGTAGDAAAAADPN